MRKSMIAITYIGHATTLIECDNKVVLTDPNFSKRVLFVKRSERLNFDPLNLPELSAILISHAHFDHLDIDSFKYIKSSVPIFVPPGLSKYLGKFIRNPIIELREWSTHKLPINLEITATPAHHTGFRWSMLRFRKCNGYIINFANPGARVYFAGDTGYGPHFKDIALSHAKPIDVALLPIGAYEPRWFMKKRHLNPVEATQAFLDLRAIHMVPIHHSAFKLSAEKLNEPTEWLERVASERDLTQKVHILRSGEKVNL